MDESHDLEHRKAGCIYQHQFFKDIISSIGNVTKIKVFNTYEENIKNFHYDDFDVFLWTGGLGNIYLSNQHNKDQLYVCEKILELDKPLWGSCWGLQVIATCFGEKIVKTNKSEFGFAKNINILHKHEVYQNKLNFFTAPGHHYDHLERIGCADLFIDTFNYNAHTTCSDALWAGVPVVTKKGSQFSSRVAASLLSSLGLNELITETKDDYKNLILNLSLNHKKLFEIKKKLKNNILNYPLFDTLTYTKNFEKSLIKIYENRLNNLKDEDIEI